MNTYTVFHRTFWKDSKGWPNGLEPCAGERHHIADVESEELAREICKEWNNNHDKGRYSDKAEYEQD